MQSSIIENKPLYYVVAALLFINIYSLESFSAPTSPSNFNCCQSLSKRTTSVDYHTKNLHPVIRRFFEATGGEAIIVGHLNSVALEYTINRFLLSQDGLQQLLESYHSFRLIQFPYDKLWLKVRRKDVSFMRYEIGVYRGNKEYNWVGYISAPDATSKKTLLAQIPYGEKPYMLINYEEMPGTIVSAKDIHVNAAFSGQKQHIFFYFEKLWQAESPKPIDEGNPIYDVLEIKDKSGAILHYYFNKETAQLSKIQKKGFLAYTLLDDYQSIQIRGKQVLIPFVERTVEGHTETVITLKSPLINTYIPSGLFNRPDHLGNRIQEVFNLLQAKPNGMDAVSAPNSNDLENKNKAAGTEEYTPQSQ